MTAFNIKGASRRAALIGLILSGALSGCATGSVAELPRARLEKARSIFAERCKHAGAKINRTVVDVDGFVLLKLRPKPIDFDSQFVWDDPYGNDLYGDGYIESFIRGSFQTNHQGMQQGGPARVGYQFVDVIDPNGTVRFRYTGHAEEPWLTDKSYLKGYLKFVLKRAVTSSPMPRYGLTYDDISTQEDRKYWIAGSSLRVVDLVTGDVLGERVGYMMDPLQGNRVGGRSPWLLAADTACPQFPKYGGTALQARQAQDFVETVLFPKQ